MKYQSYGIDADGKVTHAGISKNIRRMDEAAARHIQQGWEKWRTRYLREHPGDYPLRQDARDPRRKTVTLLVHPVGQGNHYQIYHI